MANTTREFKDWDRDRHRRRIAAMTPEEDAARKRKNYANHIKRKFGLTIEDYDKMVEEQNGSCHICESTNTYYANGRLAIDHSHKTGRIRKLLCGHCNTVLGSVFENVEILKRMIAYLEEHDNEASSQA